MIPFPLVSPTKYGVASVSWGPVDTTARARNPWTLRLNTQVHDGRMWAGTLTISPNGAAEGRSLAAWLTALRRPGENAGTFLLGDPAAPAPLGAAADTPGTPVVDGAGQTGEALAVTGLPASTTGYLLAGDYVQLGSGASARLLMVLEDADSDAQGDATLRLWPGVRTAPADGAPIVVDGPQGLFVTATNTTRWEVRPSLVYQGVRLEVGEVVP